MSSRRTLRSRHAQPDPAENASNAGSRSTRTYDAIGSSGPVSVSRSPDPSRDSQRSIRLTLKMPSNKLREVTTGAAAAKRENAAGGKRSVNIFAENPIVSGPRNSRSKKRIVEVDTSEDNDDDDDENNDDDEDDEHIEAEGENELDDEEEMDADGDIDMGAAPPQQHSQKKKSKSGAAVVPNPRKPGKSIESRGMGDEDDDEDEEMSESDLDDREPERHYESGNRDDLANANGDEDEDLDEDEGNEVEGVDSDQGTPATGSRMSTPDFSKLTKRQRGSLGNDFLQLPMEPQVKKHLTAEERAMRRAEMARRRKNLSEKRNEEEKMDTINRLLRKQAPKRRGRVSAAEVAEGSVPQPEEEQQHEAEKPDPTLARWVSNRDGCRVGVPEEWLGTPAGRMFGNGPAGGTGVPKLVEEV